MNFNSTTRSNFVLLNEENKDLNFVKKEGEKGLRLRRNAEVGSVLFYLQTVGWAG